MVWDGRHHLCAVHVVNDMQYVVFDCCNVRCVDVLFFQTCFEVLYSQLWNVLHFYIPDGSRFLKCNKDRCFFWSFHHLHKESCFSSFLSCFKQCILDLSGLLGLNAVTILPLYCNAIIVWSLEMFCVFSQAFISMLANRGTVSVCGCIGFHFDGLLSQLLDALHPSVLFIAIWLTSEDAGYDWVWGM